MPDTLKQDLPVDKLPWAPINVIDWDYLLRPLTPEARGAVVMLRLYSWTATPRCTVPDNDTNLAMLSGLGPRWGEIGDEIRALLYQPYNGRLLDVAWRQTYDEQAAKWLARSFKGAKGGRPSTKTPGKPQHIAGVMPSLGPGSDSLTSQFSSTSENGEKRDANPSLTPGFDEARLLALRAAWMADPTNDGKRLPTDAALLDYVPPQADTAP